MDSSTVTWLSSFKERRTIITGERHAFIADTLSADLTLHANASVSTELDAVAMFRGVSEGNVIRYAIANPRPLRAEHGAFRDAVLGIDADIVPVRQGPATVRVADVTLRSAETGETVLIE